MNPLSSLISIMTDHLFTTNIILYITGIITGIMAGMITGSMGIIMSITHTLQNITINIMIMMGPGIMVEGIV